MALQQSALEEDEQVTVVQGENEVSVMLANALKKMDGLVSEYSPHSNGSGEANSLPPDPQADTLVSQCENLRALVMQWQERGGGGRENGGDVRQRILPETREFLASWLSNKQTVKQYQKRHSVDNEELQQQVILMTAEAKRTAKKMETIDQELQQLRSQLSESEVQNMVLSQQLQTTQLSLETREAEIAMLAKEKEFGHLGSQDGDLEMKLTDIPPGVDATHQTQQHTESPKSPESPFQHQPESPFQYQPGSPFQHQLPESPFSLKQAESVFQRVEPQRRSLRKALSKAFSRKKSPIVAPISQDHEDSPNVINTRASAFQMKDAKEVGEWVKSIGLDMYQNLVEQHVPSGDRLFAMTTGQAGNSDLVNIGIVNTLHCKKLRLAVEEATVAIPTPMETLGHAWVAEWLHAIGLPQYVRTFSEARIDGRMLNYISMSDLDLLDLNEPFHLLSLQRGIQAFRICGYNPNYLKDSAAASKGSQKLLHWTAQDVARWLCSIDLDQYVGAVDGVGLHGALMLLEMRFTSESLARLLGIHESKTIIRKHLSKKFLEVLGPVAAQKKLDAMQNKSFQPIDPSDRARCGIRVRGKSFRRSRHESSEEELLCSLNEFPASSPSPVI